MNCVKKPNFLSCFLQVTIRENFLFLTTRNTILSSLLQKAIRATFLFLLVHEKHLSLTENNSFAGFTTDANQRNVKRDL